MEKYKPLLDHIQITNSSFEILQDFETVIRWDKMMS